MSRNTAPQHVAEANRKNRYNPLSTYTAVFLRFILHMYQRAPNKPTIPISFRSVAMLCIKKTLDIQMKYYIVAYIPI